MSKIDTRYLTFFLIDEGHPLTKVWELSNYDIKAQTITGTLTAVNAEDAPDVVTVRNNADARASKDEVLMFAKTEFAQKLEDKVTLTIPFSEISKIEVYEANFGKTVAMYSLSYLAIGFILLIIALAAKSSCPFVYADNPDGVRLQGELYSGATYPQLERHDWLPLPDLKPNGNTYNIRIANRAKEIQHTNLLELQAFDHPAGMEILVDKYGKTHTLQNTVPPSEAIDYEGNTALNSILKPDTLVWHGSEFNQRPQADEALMLRFPKPAGAQKGKLVLRAKNTAWLDYMYGLFLDEFGTYSGKLRERYLQKSRPEIQEWIDNQRIPLSVSVETAPGLWQKADAFNLAGPIALKKDVLELDLSAIPGNEVRVKLESGYLFWEIDYVGMDYSDDQMLVEHKLSPQSAVNQYGVEVAGMLRSDDGAYYTQPAVGDEALVRFEAPPLPAGMERTLILHAKGHYEILRPPLEHTPNLLSLQRFQKPDALPRYSRERWLGMTEFSTASTSN